MAILAGQQIINTYNVRQQEQCRLFFEYKRIKNQKPMFGYKRISKILGQPAAKTRWWNAGKHIPVPVQTVSGLKQRGLLPLEENNQKIKLIVKVLGATFGDGGIFENLNGIFLSSAELEAVKEFGEDLKKIFGEKIGQNSRIIEGGEWGHSWCYQNTNRSVIRFFMALGAPIGDKSFTNLIVPEWIKNSKESIQDEFFGSFFGNEIGIPKVHIGGRHMDTFSLGITGSEKFAENRITFLKEVADYLTRRFVVAGSISVNDHKKVNRKGESTKVYKLLLSVTFESMTNFMTLTKLNYCKYKQEKLGKSMNGFATIKRQRYQDLKVRGYSHDRILKSLQINGAMWRVISMHEDFTKIYDIELGSARVLSGN